MIPMTLAALGMAGAAAAPAWPPAAFPHAADAHRYQVERHRYELDRLRLGADQRDMLARQLQLETQLNRLRIEGARRPEPVQPQPGRALRSPEEERALRLSAEDGRRASSEGVGQIDAWLDRAPR